MEPEPGESRFVIVDPADGIAGTPVTVRVEVRDANNNLNVEEQRDVTLVTSGSATGAGLVNIANGSGTIQINDLVVETVNLSLTDSQGTGLDVSSTQSVAFNATGAARFVILPPSDGAPGAPITVQVEAQTSAGARATLENRDVTLVVGGSATGGGVVDILSGIGSIAINDAVAETVDLSLADHLGLGLDVSSVANATFTSAPTQLAFRPITGGSATGTITVEVELRDAGGALTGSDASVTIAIETNPGAMLFHASGFLQPVLEHVNYISPQVVTPALPNVQIEEVIGLTYDPANNRVIAGLLQDNLMTYDPATGAETLLGASGLGEGPSGLAFEMGGANRLLGVSSAVIAEVNDLFEVNTATGAMTSLGTLTAGFAFNGLQGLATDPTSGTIYGIAMEPPPARQTRHLVIVDPAGLTMTDMGVFPVNGMADMTFMPDGTLLGVSGDGSPQPERLFTINKADASLVQITTLGNGDDGEAITYVPAQLVGTVTVDAVAGVATFTVKIPAPAMGYTLRATAAGLTGATSAPFDISN